ncbi:MAG TPA: hypothetical protein PKB12_01510, partial [Elusimicrobiota bacterium]|nr:hypothetical protein [Elusimicrobiota bacterium]
MERRTILADFGKPLGPCRRGDLSRHGVVFDRAAPENLARDRRQHEFASRTGGFNGEGHGGRTSTLFIHNGGGDIDLVKEVAFNELSFPGEKGIAGNRFRARGDAPESIAQIDGFDIPFGTVDDHRFINYPAGGLTADNRVGFKRGQSVDTPFVVLSEGHRINAAFGDDPSSGPLGLNLSAHLGFIDFNGNRFAGLDLIPLPRFGDMNCHFFETAGLQILKFFENGFQRAAVKLDFIVLNFLDQGAGLLPVQFQINLIPNG